jgi:hypothetical protein
VDGSPNKGVTQDDNSGYFKRWGNTNAVDKGDVHFYTVSNYPHPLASVATSSNAFVYLRISSNSILHSMQHQ